MFHLSKDMSYWLYPQATDLRKSFYTLSGLVTDGMGRNVRDGEVFIFINRNRDSMKILHAEYSGLVLYHLRLESGRFKLPIFDPLTNSFRFSWHDLMQMVRQKEPIRRRVK